MVNDLEVLLRGNAESPPPDRLDLGDVVDAGRRRVRTRRRRGVLVGSAGLAVAALGAAAVLHAPLGLGDPGAAGQPPAPDAPTLHLRDAGRAVAGQDYRVLASYTDRNLDAGNGQSFDGVTTDGEILFRDGTRLALMDPATGHRDWLPARPRARHQAWQLELGSHRLVLVTEAGLVSNSDGTMHMKLGADVYDRGTGRWTETTWPDLPTVERPNVVMGPDQRLYVLVPATQGQPPAGGGQTGAGGEVDDSFAPGSTYRLWSVSPTDSTDVRDEGLTVGDIAFSDTTIVWTDASNGAAGQVHVRDLATGASHSFDPQMGDRCNLLSLGATSDRVVMSEYCGTYDGGVRDDRVQVVSLTGRQVVTVQDSGIDGGLAGTDGRNDLVRIAAQGLSQPGSYVYDLGSGRFLRLDNAVSAFDLGGPTPSGQLLWTSAVNHGHGATQWLGQFGP